MCEEAGRAGRARSRRAGAGGGRANAPSAGTRQPSLTFSLSSDRVGQIVNVHVHGTDPQVVRANKLHLVERLADDLAHEIRNPLHSMVINLEVLKRRVARLSDAPPEELMRYVGVLGSELERVNRRVELLLRMVRPSRDSEPTTLAEVVEELLELLELERDRRNLHVRFEPASAAERRHLPRDLARQLVLNLLLGTLDAVAPGGTLTIRTEVGEGWTHLHLDAAPAVGAGAGTGPVDRDSLAVARALGESVGGRVEVGSGARNGGAQRSDDTLAVVLSLPLAAAPAA